MSIIYLACPYSAGTAQNRLARFHAVTAAAAKLVEREKVVFSPITMTHPIDLVMAAHGETLGSEFWVRFDEAFVAACSEFYILMLPGWDRSSGIAREAAWFRSRGIEPVLMNPADYGVLKENALFAAAFE